MRQAIRRFLHRFLHETPAVAPDLAKLPLTDLLARLDAAGDPLHVAAAFKLRAQSKALLEVSKAALKSTGALIESEARRMELLAKQSPVATVTPFKPRRVGN